MLGLETALSIVNQTMVQTGLMNWAAVAERMSYAPARIGLYENQGRELIVGSPAHIAVMDPTSLFKVDRDLVASRSRNTPFHGMELPGQIIATVFNGEVVYEGGRS
jgi:dihydroorotase